MSRQPKPENLLAARLAGRTTALRGVLRKKSDAELEARHRDEWPELWEKIDELLEVIDW